MVTVMWFNDSPAEVRSIQTYPYSSGGASSVRGVVLEQMVDFPEAVLAVARRDPPGVSANRERWWAFRICPRTRQLIRVGSGRADY